MPRNDPELRNPGPASAGLPREGEAATARPAYGRLDRSRRRHCGRKRGRAGARRLDVVEFPGSKFNGEIAPVLDDLVNRGLIRVLDLLVLKKDDDGSLEAFELSDLDDSEPGQLRSYETGLAMVLSEQDVKDVAAAIEPGSSAGVLVWENLWAAPLATAVRDAGGQLVASGRIPIQAVLAAIEADAEEDAEEGA